MKRLKFICALLFVFQSVFSQNIIELTEINTQIWEPFSVAFETSNFELFGSLHSDDLIRIGADGKRILKKDLYIQGYKNKWSNKKQNRTISFRFLERIVNDKLGSERGIYKLTINSQTEQEQSYYGKFHVILRKEDSVWKILVDYDSSEGNTINSDSYENAFAINDFSRY